MKYALTGGTGFVGGRLAALLVREGHEVTALVRDPGRARALADLGIHLVRGDVCDVASVREAVTGTDGLFHVAGWYHLGARDPAPARRTNVEGTRAVLAAARQADVPRLVYTSTLAVNSDTGDRMVDETYRFTGKHLSLYDATKAEAHDLVDQAASDGLPVVTVMPGMVYGPGDTSQTGMFIRQVLRGRRVIAPAGGRLCWGYVDDIARGHLLAMQVGRRGESYMLAGPPYSLAAGLRVVARIAGTRGPIVVPASTIRVAQAVMARVERFLPIHGTYSAEALRASLATYLGSPAKAERELGWSARSLEDGITAMVRAERSAGRAGP